MPQGTGASICGRQRRVHGLVRQGNELPQVGDVGNTPCGGERTKTRQGDRELRPDVQPEPHMREDTGWRGCDGPQDLDHDEVPFKLQDKLDIFIAVHNGYQFC